jgi:hypothetical protein
MPTFEIELADGRKFQVDADSQQQALAGVQSQFGRKSPAAPEPSDDIISGLQQGVANAIGGVGKTMKHYTPWSGKGAEETAAEIAPENYKPARIIGEDWSVNPSEAPRAVAEAAPAMGGGILLARLLARRFGPLASALGGVGGVSAATQLGQRAEDRAVEAGEDPSAPSTTSKLAAAATTAATTVPEVIAGRRFLPGAGGRPKAVGAAGVTEAAKRAGGTALIEGGTEGVQEGIEQAGRTIGTEGGLRFKPTDIANAAATGAVAGPTFTAGRTAREVNQAIKYRDMDPTVAQEVANDIAATEKNTASPRGGFEAVSDVEDNYRADLSRAAKAFRKEAEIDTGEVNGILKRAGKGKQLSDRDINTLENFAEDTASGGDVVALAKRLNTLHQLKQTAAYDPSNKRFAGGMGNWMQNNIWFLNNPVKGAVMGSGAAAGLLNPGIVVHAPAAMAAGVGAYGAARMVDSVMGTRAPVKAFVDRFSGGKVKTRPPSGDMPSTPWSPTGEFDGHLRRGPQGPEEFDSHLRPRNTLPVPYRGPPQPADNTIYQGAPPREELLPPPTPRAPTDERPVADGPINMPGGLPMLPPPTPGAPIMAGAPEPQRMLPPPGPAPQGPASSFPQTQGAPIALPGPKAPPSAINRMRLLEALRAREEAPHEPVINDGPAPIDTARPLSMAEELDRDAVLGALRSGANTFGEVRKAAEIDAETLNRVLSRLSAEGKVARDGAGIKLVGEKPAAPTPVPAAVRAKAKAAAPKPAPTPAPTDDGFDIPDFLARAPAPVKQAATPAPALTAAVKSMELPDLESTAVRDKVAAFRAKKETVFSKPAPKVQPAPKPVAPKSDDDFAIPDFLDRRKPAATPMEAAIAETVADDGPAKSPIYDTDVDKVIERAIADNDSKKGKVLHPDRMAKYNETTRRIISEKHATAKAIAKEIAGFDVDDFASRYLHARSLEGGAAVRDWAKRRYPKHDDVFDRLLSDKTFSTVFSNKSSKKDGTRKR